MSCSTRAQLVERLVEPPAPPLVLFARNGDSDAAAAQPVPDAPITVGFIAGQALRAAPRAPTARSFDGSLVHQLLKNRALMLLAGLEHKGDRLALALGAHVQLGKKSAARRYGG